MEAHEFRNNQIESIVVPSRYGASEPEEEACIAARQAR